MSSFSEPFLSMYSKFLFIAQKVRMSEIKKKKLLASWIQEDFRAVIEENSTGSIGEEVPETVFGGVVHPLLHIDFRASWLSSHCPSEFSFGNGRTTSMEVLAHSIQVGAGGTGSEIFLVSPLSRSEVHCVFPSFWVG